MKEEGFYFTPPLFMKTLTYYTKHTLGFRLHPVPKIDASLLPKKSITSCLLSKGVGRKQGSELRGKDYPVVNDGHKRTNDVLALVCQSRQRTT